MAAWSLSPLCWWCVVCVFTFPLTVSQFMTECERGVRRPHPTQENAYQVFVLSEQDSRWLEESCPSPKVFHPVQCACVRPPTLPTPPPTPPTTPPHTTPSAPPTPPTSAVQERGDWFSESKLVYGKRDDLGQQEIEKKRGPPKREHQQNDRGQLTKSYETKSPWERQVSDKVPVDCTFFRPRGTGSSQYERWTDGGWLLMDCNWPVNSGLEWRQELCRCDWGPNPVLGQPDLSSIPAVCLMMLNMTFDDGQIKDVGRDLWLDLRHPFSMEAVRDDTAVGGWAGAFRGAGISVPFFKMNTLGSTFRIKFRFRLCEGHPDSDLMLFNNGCVESDATPSLQISYQAWSNVLAFNMATTNGLGPYREECHIKHLDQDSWTDINIHYDQDRLHITANDQECVRSAAYFGPIVQTDCPLMLLEDNFCGLLDEVVVTRGCTSQQES